MSSETPFEGNEPNDGNEPPYRWLDEWLCEYVDGTMDPSLEAVFEQYVEANPDLKAHVQRLQRTRDLLGNVGRSEVPGFDGEENICRTVENNVPAPSSTSEPETDRRRPPALGLLSSVAVALVVGFLGGATVVSSSPEAPPAAASPESNARSLPHRTPAVQPLDVRRYQSTEPIFPPDSVRRQSSLTTIGIP